MNKNAKILLAGVLVGAVTGMLYAPLKGAETRRKLKKLKEKLSGGNEDKQSLEEMSDMLQKELDKINRKLEKL